MRVLINKTNNVAEDLIYDNTNIVITTRFYNAENNQVATEEESDHKGCTVTVDGHSFIMSPLYEIEIHENVTEVKALDGEIGKHECLKGTTIKVEDYSPMTYTYNGSTWAAV